MTESRGVRYSAGAGALGIVLFAAGAMLVGERPGFDEPGAAVAAHLEAERTPIQLGSALFALAAASIVWFAATAAALAAQAGREPGRVALGALGCTLVFVALFLADITTLAVAALRPENMRAEPELAATLRDLELLLMGAAAPVVAAALAGFALLPLRHGVVWPRWVGGLGAVAAVLYLLRTGTLFTTEGAFAADGVLGLYVPVGAFATWVVAASVTLALAGRR